MNCQAIGLTNCRGISSPTIALHVCLGLAAKPPFVCFGGYDTSEKCWKGVSLWHGKAVYRRANPRPPLWRASALSAGLVPLTREARPFSLLGGGTNRQIELWFEAYFG